MTTIMTDQESVIGQFKGMIEEELASLAFPDCPADLYDPIKYILSIGGKRIRPLLVLLGADVFDSEQVAKALPAALAVEMFHNFTLMHDDIMDEAPLRRGMQTVHEKWDTNVAILAGDNLMVLSYDALAGSELDKVPHLLKMFNKMAREICEGQQLDVEFEKKAQITQEAYIDMIRKKTAVLLGTALKMGAIIAGASEDQAEHLYDFGINIGIAFQLQDDILDVYGDPNTFGKQVGGDILANKKTILLTTAFQHASGSLLQTLTDWSNVTNSDPAQVVKKIEAVKAVYDALGVKRIAANLQEQYVNRAFGHLEKLEIAPERFSTLQMLAQSLLTRIN